jgi:hypothetical protein
VLISALQENEKRLKQLVGTKEGSPPAAQANRHGEQPIPAAAAKQLKYFFKREGEHLQALLREHPRVRVVDCGLTHFFKPCNATHCRPSFEAELAAIDLALEREVAYREATAAAGGAWRRSSVSNGPGANTLRAEHSPASSDSDDDPEAILGADGMVDWEVDNYTSAVS